MENKANQQAEEIAWNIMNSIFPKDPSTIRIRTENGFEDIKIDEIDIVIEKLPDATAKKVFAEAKYSERRKSPYYPIQDITQIASQGESKVKFKTRSDGMANPENVQMKKTEAVEVIKNLTKEDYVETSYESQKRPADVYIKNTKVKTTNRNIKLYIKLCIIKKSRNILVISFHEEGI